jgi:hypothetical protein
MRLLRVALALAAVAAGPASSAAERAGAPKERVVLLPFEGPAPSQASRNAVVAAVSLELARHGYDVVPPEAVEATLADARVRYVAEVSRPILSRLCAEQRASAVLAGRVLVAGDRNGEPVVAVLAALWSPEGALRWDALVALAGRDTEGLLGMGRATGVPALATRLSRDLLATLPRDGTLPAARREPSPWRPRSRALADALLVSGERPRICVLPLANDTAERTAARVADALLRRQLARAGFDVVPAAELRAAMGDEKTWILGAWDAPQLERIAKRTGARLFAVGQVAAFGWGRAGTAEDVRIELSLVDPRARVLWRRGRSASARDYSGFLGLGEVSTAVGLADRVVERLVRDLERS